MNDAVVFIPAGLAAACRQTAERAAWLERLPDAIRTLQDRWRLSLEPPFDSGDVSCAWVARALRPDGTPAVLKLGMPLMEGIHELEGLRFWNGDPTVRVLAAAPELNAMLLESCEPGIALGSRPEPEQDVVVAGLLRRLWRKPSAWPPFRPLAAMTAFWAQETMAAAQHWPDRGLVQEGLRILETLSRPSPEDVLLATDLHAGNVLSARREPWLVIDPKPFVGDSAYDATQHLLNCRERLLTDPDSTIRRFGDLLEVDAERVRLWLFARSAAEPRDDWSEGSFGLANALA